MTNFFDMRCQECGDETEIDIAATLWVRVCSDGTDADASGDSTHTFQPDSPAIAGIPAIMGPSAHSSHPPTRASRHEAPSAVL